MPINKRDWRLPEVVLLVLGLLCLVVSLFKARVRIGTVTVTSAQLWYVWLMLLVLAVAVAIGREGIAVLTRGMKDRGTLIAILDSLPYIGAVALGIWGEIALLRMFGAGGPTLR